MGVEIVKASVEHALYRFFSEDGALLYVGISADPFKRMTQHRDGKPWWSEVAQVTIERHPSRSAALLAEAAAIRDEVPRYNILRPSEPKPRTRVRFSYYEPAVNHVVTVVNVAPVEAQPIPCHECREMCPPRQITELVNGDLWYIGKCGGCRIQVFRIDPPTQHRLELVTEVAA